MNDGGYQPWKPEIGETYDANMRKVLDRLDEAGVKTVVVGSPGAVDTNFFRPGQTMGEQPAHVAYNDTLAHLRDIDKHLAAEKNLHFADIHAAMIDAMRKANEARGPQYDVCGGDGFRPGPNGQLDIESRRWPFCFEGDGTASSSTRSILPFVPFNDDLNRYVLKVRNLTAPRAKVTWGTEAKEFTREQLEKGINLAAEFPRTPFDEPFAALSAAVADKQAYETHDDQADRHRLPEDPGHRHRGAGGSEGAQRPPDAPLEAARGEGPRAARAGEALDHDRAAGRVGRGGSAFTQGSVQAQRRKAWVEARTNLVPSENSPRPHGRSAFKRSGSVRTGKKHSLTTCATWGSEGLPVPASRRC